MEPRNYKMDQLMVIVTSVLSLITAGIWSEIMESFFEKYFNNGMGLKLVYAVAITIVTVYLIDWLVKTKQVNKEMHEQLQEHNLTTNIGKLRRFSQH